MRLPRHDKPGIRTHTERATRRIQRDSGAPPARPFSCAGCLLTRDGADAAFLQVRRRRVNPGRAGTCAGGHLARRGNREVGGRLDHCVERGARRVGVRRHARGASAVPAAGERQEARVSLVTERGRITEARARALLTRPSRLPSCFRLGSRSRGRPRRQRRPVERTRGAPQSRAAASHTSMWTPFQTSCETRRAELRSGCCSFRPSNLLPTRCLACAGRHAHVLTQWIFSAIVHPRSCTV